MNTENRLVLIRDRVWELVGNGAYAKWVEVLKRHKLPLVRR